MRTTAIVLLALIGGLTLPVNLHADGKEIFEKNCKTCHGPDVHKTRDIAQNDFFICEKSGRHQR